MPRRPPGQPPKKRGRPAGSKTKKAEWLEDYAALGEMPVDPLAGVEWGLRALMISLHKTVNDKGIHERERTRQIQSHLRSMKDLLPKARLAEAERRIMEFEKRMKEPAKPAEGEARIEDVAEPGSPLATDYRAIRSRGK